jgi:hypothetical protein
MKQVKIFDKTYNVVEDNGKWMENCPKCDLFKVCDSFKRNLDKLLCDTPTGGIGFYHFEELKSEI